MNKILEGLVEAYEVAIGRKPAKRISIDGHKYIPEIEHKDLKEKYEKARLQESQAAEYVETIIAMRSHHFTGEEPYVGWVGLGKALREDYDDRDRYKLSQGQLSEALIRADTASERLDMACDRIGDLEKVIRDLINDIEATSPKYEWESVGKAKELVGETPDETP